MNRQIPLDLALSPRARFASYISAGNEKLLEIVQELAISPAPQASAALLLGPTGFGKTHLLQAATYAAWQSGRRAIFLSLNDLDVEFLEGISAFDFVAFDEIDAVAGNKPMEQRFLVVLDELRAQAATILLAGREKPANPPFTLPDLVTRLLWAATYPITALSDEGKRRLLTDAVKERGLSFDEEFADYVLKRHARDVPTLISLIERLDAESWVAKRKLTVSFARQVLSSKS